MRNMFCNKTMRNNFGPKEEAIVIIKCFIAEHISFFFFLAAAPSGPGPPDSRGF